MKLPYRRDIGYCLVQFLNVDDTKVANIANHRQAKTKLIIFREMRFLYAEDDDGLHYATHIQRLNRNWWQGHLSVIACPELKPSAIP